MKTVMASAGFAAGTLTAFGMFATHKMMYIKTRTDEEIAKDETGSHANILSDFQKQTKEPFAIESPHGYHIHGFYIAADPPNQNRFMVFCHGVTLNLFASVKYANLFLKRGFNVILFDERRHGKTGGRTTSYGYYEKDDLAAVVHWIKKRFSDNILLGIHGVSMGAATLLQYAGLVEDGADFYIADCPYSDISEQMLYLLKRNYPFPKWPIFPLTKLFIRVRDGYNLEVVSPMSAVRNISHPVLFIHSKNDNFIPSQMTQDLYEKKPDKKQLFIAEKGGHGCAYRENPEAYEGAIDRFLKDYVPRRPVLTMP
ncbi:alpha/beta hydrolase [Sporolactobacillus sp. THM7-7]|nr:alpha/beta hydrolase [Sporolactobacillus sp. THM7-7]